MINKSIVKMALLAFSLILIGSFGANAQDCTKTNDSEIANTVGAKIEAKYESQWSHINVRVKDGVVTLGGWVTTKNIRKDIEKIAKKTKCVKKVFNNLRIGVGGGCAPGFKSCNGECIPNSENCPPRTKGSD